MTLQRSIGCCMDFEFSRNPNTLPVESVEVALELGAAPEVLELRRGADVVAPATNTTEPVVVVIVLRVPLGRRLLSDFVAGAGAGVGSWPPIALT
jgi:hypothetical protein